jgi:hypothetical protein
MHHNFHTADPYLSRLRSFAEKNTAAIFMHRDVGPLLFRARACYDKNLTFLLPECLSRYQVECVFSIFRSKGWFRVYVNLVLYKKSEQRKAVEGECIEA